MDALFGRDRKEAIRFVGTRIDVENLLWAARYRVYFDLSAEEILNYTVRRAPRADASVLRRVAMGVPPAAVAADLWPEAVDTAALTGRPPEETLPALELALLRHLYRQGRETLHRYPFHLGTVLAYLVLLESEGRDLIAAVEGQAAGWPSGRIRSQLICLAA